METDLSPSNILPRAIDVYSKKAGMKFGKLMVLSFMAGVFIALAASTSSLAAVNFLRSEDSFGLGKIIQALSFTPGLIFVVLAGGELFTGNCLMVFALFKKKIKIGGLLKSWILVYLGNFLGAIFVAYILSWSGQWELGGGLIGARTILIAKAKLDFSFSQGLILGIFANLMVCLGVWMSLGARSYGSKAIACFFPVSLFVMAGFEHSIANMYYIPAGIFAKNIPGLAAKSGLSLADLSGLNFTDMVFKNLVPVTIGNIIGGSILVGLIYFLAYREED